ncbi:MAG: N-formylglutamate amidohydrolase [Sneathiella sp.]
MQDVTELEQQTQCLREGAASVLLICEHASNFIPEKYGGLGLPPDKLASHIAWDPGALAVASFMKEKLSASLVACEHSRLLFDCNRAPERCDAIREECDGITIPGNKDLSTFERNERLQEFYEPFRAKVEKAANKNSVIVTIHSFTPVYSGQKRDVEIGILHDTDTRLADALFSALEASTGYIVRRNEPYNASDGVTHTLKVHAIERGKLNVMLEIRNDLIRDANSQKTVADMLSTLLRRALLEINAEKDGVRIA